MDSYLAIREPSRRPVTSALCTIAAKRNARFWFAWHAAVTISVALLDVSVVTCAKDRIKFKHSAASFLSLRAAAADDIVLNDLCKTRRRKRNTATWA